MSIWFWLVIYQLKHFVADYPLQSNQFMLRKFLPGWEFALPLVAHCLIHALFTLVIALCINASLWWVALIDFSIHFTMDRLKAGPKYMGRWKALTMSEYLVVAERVDKIQLGVPRDNDEAEALKKLRGNTLFWNSLGLDQLVHHLTHYLCLFILFQTR